MTTLNPTAEPFSYPLTVISGNESPAQTSRSSLKGLFAALFPKHKLALDRSGFKIYKPHKDTIGITYFITHGDERDESDESRRESMRNEVAILKHLELPNGDPHQSIRTYSAFLDDPTYPPAMIMMDAGKPLMAFQNDFEDGILPEDMVKVLMTQLLSGLEWIHSKGIISRDLSPKVLVTDNTMDLTLKISHFRRAIRSSDVSDRYAGGIPYYRPPDVHLGSTSYGTDYDMWSVGCIFAEMITGQQLFRWSKASLLAQIIKVLDFQGPPDHVDRRRGLWRLPWHADDASWPWHTPRGYRSILGDLWTPTSAAFINGFLQFDPDARVTASEALKSPYLRNGPIILARPPTPDPLIERQNDEIDEVLREIQILEVAPEEDEVSLTETLLELEIEEGDDTLESLLGVVTL